jgi:hypothetical protein
MTIQKAHWDTEGDNVRLSMPFSKVDQERRIVSGFATLDNIDKQSDIVTTEASMSAFSKFRGNIREMHQPSAVGKMVSFKEDKYFDPESKKFYSGVYVSAYVSKGAQDAWEKVLDGTYTGFSIGGRMNKWDDAYDEKMDCAIRIIKDYDLVELSLVDNPANQFASILSVEKVDGVSVITGIDSDTVLENIFWEKETGLVMVSENEVELSPTSGIPMQNIGFVEKSDSEKMDMIKFLVDSAKGTKTAEINKEVNTMTDTTNVDDVPVATEEDAVVETTEEVIEAEDVAVDATADVEIDKVDEIVTKAKANTQTGAVDNPEEEATEEVDSLEEEANEDMKTKKSDELSAIADLKDAVTSALGDIVSTVKALAAEVDSLKKSNELTNAKIADAEKDFENLGKSIDALEADTAFRKSGDLGEIVQEPAMVEKSVWGGRFLTNADLLK